jgi:hypothetical protein
VKRCNHCGTQCAPGADLYIGSVAYPGMYLAVFNHSCGGTYGCVLHEVPDSELLVDDELPVTCSERDAREVEAA